MVILLIMLPAPMTATAHTGTIIIDATFEARVSNAANILSEPIRGKRMSFKASQEYLKAGKVTQQSTAH